jgi:hypothetical protein
MTVNNLLTTEQKEVLVGSLLGDANLQTETAGRSWRLRMIQENKNYLFHKYEIFQNLCGTPPLKSQIFDQRTNKLYERWTFNTFIQPSFRFYAHQFYCFDPISGLWVKNVPMKISKLITPRAIAYWYMDDGSLKWKGNSNAVRFCTDSYSEEGVARLRKVLFDKFHLETTIQRKDGKPRIATTEKAYPILRELVLPYLYTSMYYKFPDGNKGVIKF